MGREGPKSARRPRCLSTLEPLRVEGYSATAQRRLAGGARKFPHRIELLRSDIFSYRAKVVDRMSISGVQEKISLRLHRGKLAPTATDGDYILKPAPGAEHLALRGDVPANEQLTMLIAERVFKIESAVNGCIRLADGELAYVTRRFDRRGKDKVPQEDFCQLMERSQETHGANYKYTGSYEDLGHILRKFCSAYRIEVERLFQRIVFCYAFSNGDAHLKNFSLLQTAVTKDYVLTPAYDLLCSGLHVPDESRLALDLFSDDFETPSSRARGFNTGACFLELARRFGIAAPRRERLLAPFIERSKDVLDLVRSSFLSPEARTDYVSRYEDRLLALRAGID